MFEHSFGPPKKDDEDPKRKRVDALFGELLLDLRSAKTASVLTYLGILGEPNDMNDLNDNEIRELLAEAAGLCLDNEIRTKFIKFLDE